MKIALKSDFIELYQTERGAVALMVLNTILSVALLIFSLANLNTNASVAKIGYGDIGGYRDGAWYDMLAFPLLAINFGLFHNLLALRIFHKRGGAMAKFFLLTTTALILGAIRVFACLVGES